MYYTKYKTDKGEIVIAIFDNSEDASKFCKAIKLAGQEIFYKSFESGSLFLEKGFIQQ